MAAKQCQSEDYFAPIKPFGSALSEMFMNMAMLPFGLGLRIRQSSNSLAFRAREQ